VSLIGELASSREVLRASGLRVELPGAVDVVDTELQELFGWVVREGVTNVIRHARATTCTITVGSNWIEILDDGRGGPANLGSGLTGLRERVAAVGGTVDAGGCAEGWRLRVEVPADRVRPAAAPAAAVAPTESAVA
jgi:two-component system sensor histidine kinase DesK